MRDKLLVKDIENRIRRAKNSPVLSNEEYKEFLELLKILVEEEIEAYEALELEE